MNLEKLTVEQMFAPSTSTHLISNFLASVLD